LVQTEVTGSGHWKLIDNDSAKITIAAACNCLEGDLTINKGTFKAEQNFKTSGHLHMTGLNSLIEVVGGHTARFSAPTGCAE
jgi:hypothetical protein